MYSVLFSLLGVVAGFILAKIAPEELELGKKYFIYFQNLLYVLILFVILFFLYPSYIFMLVFFVSSVVLFFIKRKIIWIEILTYGFFFSSLFLIKQQSFYPILASLLFIYGFPIGSLLECRKKI